jgi:large subunit ribosomal protein L1
MGKTKTQFIGETLPEEKKPGSAKKASTRKEKTEKVRIAGQKGGERIKLVESELITPEASSSAKAASHRAPKVRSKKYFEAKAKIDNSKHYSIREAVSLIKDTAYTKFDGTVELHLVVRKVGLSSNVTLPYPTGKQKKIEVADEATIKKLEKGKVDFGVLLATAEMMPSLVPFARILGPKGLMPNPKNGTIIKTKDDAKKFSDKKITIKTEKKAPIIHTIIGKVSQKDKELAENAEAIIEAVNKKQVLKCYLSATMSPSVKVEMN